MKIPETIQKSICPSGHDIFWKAYLSAKAEGKPESVCYAKAWGELLFKGYTPNESGVWQSVIKESQPFTFSQNVNKILEDQRMVYGWATVIEENGVPVVDYQGDLITSSDLLSAAHSFISSSRAAKVMHEGGKVGEFVESIVFTKEVQTALGIDLGKVGWWVGLKIHDDKIWQAVKDGKLRMLSIGGRGKRIDNA